MLQFYFEVQYAQFLQCYYSEIIIYISERYIQK